MKVFEKKKRRESDSTSINNNKGWSIKKHFSLTETIRIQFQLPQLYEHHRLRPKPFFMHVNMEKRKEKY